MQKYRIWLSFAYVDIAIKYFISYTPRSDINTSSNQTVTVPMSLSEIVKGCKRQDHKAQQELYNTYADTMFGICRRYVKIEQDAEDVFIEGFYKIFSKIDMYAGKGSFEGWMKKIMVNESLMHLRKQKHFLLSIGADNIQIGIEPHIENDLMNADVIKYMDLLPTGYRTVFNLYCVEGYKHREIAELLGISINTSKSQLILAKKRMQQLIKKKQHKVG